MKKLLSILAAVGLTATASTAVVSCGSSKKSDTPSNPTVDGALNLGSIQATQDGIWGNKSDLVSTELGPNDTANTGAETLTNYLDSTKASPATKKVASSIKTTLGLTTWFTGEVGSKEPAMESAYLSTKPSFNNGTKQARADLLKLKNDNTDTYNNIKNNKAGTYYIVAWNKADNSKTTQAAAVIKVEFKAYVTNTPKITDVNWENASTDGYKVVDVKGKNLPTISKEDLTIKDGSSEIKDFTVTKTTNTEVEITFASAIPQTDTIQNLVVSYKGTTLFGQPIKIPAKTVESNKLSSNAFSTKTVSNFTKNAVKNFAE